MSRLSSVDELVNLLELMGRTPSPEAPDFTELDHGLQCAHELSLRVPGDTQLQVAGLVHDIGHQLGGDADHAALGGAAIETLLGSRVAAVVVAHVTAKRYLIATNPRYTEILSPISVGTLELQGGGLSDREVKAFRQFEYWRSAVTLRLADDAAKIPGRSVEGLGYWMPTIRAQIR